MQTAVMERIIHWLMKVEHIANALYMRAALYFSDYQRLSLFLEKSAEDEAGHYHAMGSAAEHYRMRNLPLQSIVLDRETEKKIEDFFTDLSARLDNRSLSEQGMLEHMVNAEFSEWNDIFQYAISYLKKDVVEFSIAARKMQNHLRQIELFLEGTDLGRDILAKFREIPPVWMENILIVDDEIMVSELIRAVLARAGSIDIAENGREALEKIQKKYYKLVISDIDMPVMDGLALYRQAAATFPSIGRRFIFITGRYSDDTFAFFRRHGIAWLEKPAPISSIRQESMKLLAA